MLSELLRSSRSQNAREHNSECYCANNMPIMQIINTISNSLKLLIALNCAISCVITASLKSFSTFEHAIQQQMNLVSSTHASITKNQCTVHTGDSRKPN